MDLRFFTQNLDTMGKSNKKKNLNELEDVNQMKKFEMGEFFGGNTVKTVEPKKRSFFDNFFGPSACSGDMPL